MFINNQQALQTLNILIARHHKVIDNHQHNDPYIKDFPYDNVQVIQSLNAVSLYNSVKQNYQPSVK